MPRFYTLPPVVIPYPYILINCNRSEPGIQYIFRNMEFIESVIIDSGVEIFRDPSIKDYPHGHFDKLVNLYKRIKKLLSDREVYVVIPDYPDDYNPKSLWVNGKDNVMRTLENIVYALTSYNDVNWLIPVQGHYRDPASVIKALELYVKYDVPIDNYIGIANLCVEERTRIIVKTIQLVLSLIHI